MRFFHTACKSRAKIDNRSRADMENACIMPIFQLRAQILGFFFDRISARSHWCMRVFHAACKNRAKKQQQHGTMHASCGFSSSGLEFKGFFPTISKFFQTRSRFNSEAFFRPGSKETQSMSGRKTIVKFGVFFDRPAVFFHIANPEILIFLGHF